MKRLIYNLLMAVLVFGLWAIISRFDPEPSIYKLVRDMLVLLTTCGIFNAVIGVEDSYKEMFN